MKTSILLSAIVALTLTGSAFAQSFSDLSPAEQSTLAYSNRNGSAYAHQMMAKQNCMKPVSRVLPSTVAQHFHS